MRLKKGDRVRMSETLKRNFRLNGSGEHIDEFGDCIGFVIGETDYNNVKPGEPDYDRRKIGPEVDVRWQPSNLRYGYDPKKLVLVED